MSDLQHGFSHDFYGVTELGKLIRNARKLRGMTQRDLAQWTNTSQKFISEVEQGKETAQIGKVLLLMRVLDLGTNAYDLKAKRGSYD